MTPERADRLQTLIWSLLGLAILGLLFWLSPVLSPFLLAGILAYICAPAVERLEKYRVPRVIGVLLVILLLIAVVVLLVLILLPLVSKEAQQLASRLPAALRLIDDQLTPWLKQHFGIVVKIDPATISRLIAENQNSAQLIAQKLLQSLKIGGTALFGIGATLLLTPVVVFYLLRDWRLILARLDNAIPRRWHTRATKIFRDIDAVLAEFLRGQLSVMLLLACYYSIGLWLAGNRFALPVGVLTGLLVFVPYLGFATGFILALLVAVLEFSGMEPIIGVLIVYGLGQMLEGLVLTPWLVGHRVGLHPLAIIFALLAFGQLFGFFGVLLALPASAALLVGLREVRGLYLESRLYRGEDRQ